jgi:hypothetical protein
LNRSSRSRERRRDHQRPGKIEFFGDDGKTFNSQVVTADVVRSIPLVAILTDVAIRKGPAVAKEIMEKLNTERTRSK